MNTYLSDTIVIFIITLFGLLGYSYLLDRIEKRRYKLILQVGLIILYALCVFWITIGSRSNQEARSYSLDLFQPFRIAYDYDLNLITTLQYLISFEWGKILSAIHLKSTPALLQMVRNVELFIPLGFILKSVIHRPLKRCFCLVTTISFLCSFSIELLQWYLACGLFEINDLINNVFGALIGMWLAAIIAGKDKVINANKF